MNWVLGILLFLVIVFLLNNSANKKKLLKLKKELQSNWGKLKKEEQFNFYEIGKYFRNNKHKKDAFHIISEKTNKDIDVNDLFKFIDRTSSKIGQQYLYFKLRTIGNQHDLRKFDSLTQLFANNEKLRINCQLHLSRLNSPNSYDLEELINGKQIEKPSVLWLIYLLSLSAVFSVVLGLFNPIFFLFLAPIFAVNLVFHYRNKDNVNYYLNGVTQLSRSLAVSKKLAEYKEIKTFYKDFLFIKRIDVIKFKAEFIGFDKNLENEFAFLLWFLIELIKIIFNVEYILFYSFIGSIIKERKSIEDLFVFLGEIDAAIAVASVKSGKIECCTPNFIEDKKIVVKDIAHPLIKDCTTNNLELTNKSMLLTGSNMSGKTTFIRTIAVNSLLAQTLNFCFAKEYNAPFLKLYSSIRISDDLLENTSYYLEEVLTIKELIAVSKGTDPCLFVLDEIFKGTNTVERISGGKAILTYLNKKNNLVFVSTHDIELTDMLEDENFSLYHFSEKIENNKLLFDHKLKSGKLKTRNAIKILEMYHYPSEIINEAKETERFYSN